MNILRVAVVVTIANLTLLTGLILRGAPVAAQGPTDVVRGRSLEVVDSSGRVRLQFVTEADGQAVLRLRDATGAVRVKLAASADGSGLVLLDDRTEPGVHVLATRAQTSLKVKKGAAERVMRP